MKVIGILAVSMLIVLVGAIIEKGEYKSEVVECVKWQNESVLYPLYFITPWQNDQCNAHGIQIQATIVGK